MVRGVLRYIAPEPEYCVRISILFRVWPVSGAMPVTLVEVLSPMRVTLTALEGS